MIFIIDLFSGSVAERAAIITAVLSTVGLMLKFVTDKRKADSGDLRYMIEAQDEDIKALKSLNQELAEKYNSLNRRFDFLENAKFQSSVPQWFKDRKSRLIYGNRAYIDQILTPNGVDYEEAIDKNDIEIWGNKDVGKLYMANDLQVIRSGVGTFFQGELVIGGTPVKYRAYIDPVNIKGQITGVAIIAVPLE